MPIRAIKNTDNCNHKDSILQNYVIVKCKSSFFKKRCGRLIQLDTYAKIRQLCEEKGINIAALAKGTGIRNSVFTELKMGRTKKLSAATLEKIAAYFNVPVSVFFDDEPAAGAERKQNELFRKRKLLFDLSARATEAELDQIIKIVDALVDGE